MKTLKCKHCGLGPMEDGDEKSVCAHEFVSDPSQPPAPKETQGQADKRKLEERFAVMDRDRLEKTVVSYFRLIERVEADRDSWKQNFYQHSAEHQEAQSMLQQALYATRDALTRAMLELNEYRKKDGKLVYSSPGDLVSEPMGVAQRFREAMLQISQRSSATVDGKAERDAIDRRLEP